MNNFARNLLVWLLAIFIMGAVYNYMGEGKPVAASNTIPFSDFLAQAENKKISEVVIKGPYVYGKMGDQAFSTYAPENTNLIELLKDKNIRISAQPQDSENPTLLSILISWFPMLLLIGVWVFFMRQMHGGGGRAMGFGRARTRMLTEKTGKVMFEDVAGIDEAKQELQEVVEFLREPQKFQKLGGKIPKGVLLVGPPGTGKTLTARAVAGEANVPFFSISGSDFVEMFVGVGAARVRDMFEQGKRNAPCIIFIDEIDALGRKRGAGVGGGNDEREQTLNQLLVEMDGFEANDGVILIAATNRPDVLDPALLRPGRFDRQVVVPNPDIVGREKILRVHMRKVPLAQDVDAKVIARGTPGFSGADLANLINEAALLAARRNLTAVGMRELENAKDKVMMGAERRSLVMTEKEKRNTAYHEVGHALVGLHMPEHDPLHKVTIIPRGRALGVTMSLPEEDRYAMTMLQLKSQLASLFGGRVAEELVFGKDQVTTGASNDIERATGLARRMITEFGMNETLGTVRYNANEDEVFLGHSVARQQNVSEETARRIDDEVRKLISWAENKAREILTTHLEDLHKISRALLEYETLSGDEVRALLRGEPIRRDGDGNPPAVVKPIISREGSVPSGLPQGT